MPSEPDRTAKIPPRWFVVSAWHVHRALYRASLGRIGLWTPKDATHWGTMRLTTIGRRTGRSRSVLLGYFEDGPNLVTLAMNGWSDGEPAWWLNLRERPEATVELKDGTRAVHARSAEGAERDRLWQRWGERMADLDAHAALRSTETAVVVLEPRA